jgi:uncharacterized membrane protein
MAKAVQLARFLGWFSFGLGLPGVAAPKQFTQFIGVKGDLEDRKWSYVVGVREIIAGSGLLIQPRPVIWAWSRVAGDVMDIALLGRALSSKKAKRPDRTAMALAAVAGITLVDLYDSLALSRKPAGASKKNKEVEAMQVKKAITISRSPEEVYQFWHDFENLPRFMQHLHSVQVTGDKKSHWKAKAPAGTTVEWDAEIIMDTPNERIAWRSLEGADVENSGSVTIKPAPGGMGTEILVDLSYKPPAGPIGAAVAKLFGEEPSQQIQQDLRRFKQIMEIGEVVVSDATFHERPHPARPPETTANKETKAKK